MKLSQTDLDMLLDRDPAEVKRELRAQFQRVADGRETSLVLFGVNSWPAKYSLEGLRRLSIQPLAFADNNEALWKSNVDGVPVLSPKEAAERYGKVAVFVVAIYNSSRPRQQLADLGCERVTTFEALFHAYPETFLPYLALDVPDKVFAEAEAVREAAQVWSDDQSREEYLAQLRFSLTLDLDALTPPSDPVETYFPSDIDSFSSKEKFVDCGAFVGDTVEEYVKRTRSNFAEIVALEPDLNNFQKLRQLVGTFSPQVGERITIRNAAVGAKMGRVRFESTGSAASAVLDTSHNGSSGHSNPLPFTVSQGVVEVESVALDEVLPERGEYLVKMDIEGAEYDGLLGAQRLLRERKCSWAICLYHRLDDLWRIPLLLSRIGGYQLYLRRYAEGFAETVCYAVPLDRSN